MGVCIWDGVFVYGWSVSLRDGVLVHGIVCYLPEWGVSIWDGVLINRIEC